MPTKHPTHTPVSQFRLGPDVVDLLRRLAGHLDLDHTAVVRLAIRELARVRLPIEEEKIPKKDPDSI